MKLYTKIKTIETPTKTTLPPSHCSVIIQNITNHSATLPFVCIGYIEIPANIDLPSAYHVHDINPIVNSVFNSYYPTLVEPKLPVRSSSSPSNLSSSSFELQNLQPSRIIQHSFPTPPYSNQTLSFLNKFKFHYSDITNDENLKICQMFVKYQNCYATHRIDVGQISTPFRIRLKPKCKLQTQRPTTLLNSKFPYTTVKL